MTINETPGEFTGADFSTDNNGLEPALVRLDSMDSLGGLTPQPMD